ncbi:MAG TPA: hypothetical protein VN735_10350 [Steroidobacteraceae bacterium]|nr:hypothetical protein [Steroidobacteraceae bacterium]
MHTDLEKIIARRLRAAADEPAESPYGWAEFQSRRQRSRLTRVIERNRPAAIAAAVLAAVVVTAVPFLRSSHEAGSSLEVRSRHEHAQTYVPPFVPPDTAVHPRMSDRQEQTRTRAIEGWLAGLPHNRVIMRVGTHAAVSSLQDQIAALDDLMSTERASNAQPGRIEALEQQREQLVSSLAQLQYAEMLASATP